MVDDDLHLLRDVVRYGSTGSPRRRRRIALIVIVALAAAFVVPVLAILFG